MGLSKKEGLLLFAILSAGLYAAGCGPSAGNTLKSNLSKTNLPIKTNQMNSSEDASHLNTQDSSSETITQTLNEALRHEINEYQVYEYTIFNNDLINQDSPNRPQSDTSTLPVITIDSDTTLANIRKGERSLAINYPLERIRLLVSEYYNLKRQGNQPTLKISVELFPNSNVQSSRRENFPKPTIVLPLQYNTADLSLHFLNAPNKTQSQTTFSILKEVRRITIEII